MVRIRAAAASRLIDPNNGIRAPLQLAVVIQSDLPPAQRGSITSGAAGAEAGLRIVSVTEPETRINYQAPIIDLTTPQVEFIMVHLATPDQTRGILLVAVPIRLLPGVN